MINIRPTSKGVLCQVSTLVSGWLSARGHPTGPALRLIPSLILGLILDFVLPSQLVLYTGVVIEWTSPLTIIYIYLKVGKLAVLGVVLVDLTWMEGTLGTPDWSIHA